MSDGPEIVVDLRAPSWSTALADAEAICREAAGAAVAAAGIAPGEISVVLVDDAFIRVLNRDHRGRDRATDVLSFPQTNGTDMPVQPGQPRLLGDIVVAYETTAADAARNEIALTAHLAHMIVHGVLHLAGHDHELEPAAEAMEALEVAALARLGIADPYAELTASPAIS